LRNNIRDVTQLPRTSRRLRERLTAWSHHLRWTRLRFPPYLNLQEYVFKTFR